MKKKLFTLILLSMTFCKSHKESIEKITNNEVINLSKCPENGVCTIEILENNEFKNEEIINERYIITEELNNVIKDVELILGDIIDFEKLHRKMILDILHPYEFVKLNENYKHILKLSNLLNDKSGVSRINLSNTEIKVFDEYINNYTKKFDFELMKKFDLTMNSISTCILMLLDDPWLIALLTPSLIASSIFIISSSLNGRSLQKSLMTFLNSLICFRSQGI